MPEPTTALGLSPAMAMLTVILGLTGLLAFANQAVNLWRNLRENPRPSETYVRLAEYREHRQQIIAQIAADRAARDADRAENARTVGALQTQIREDLRGVHARIDDLPSQIVALLKNTGAIRD